MTLGEKRFENIILKGKSGGNQYFLLFPQCFQEEEISFWYYLILYHTLPHFDALKIIAVKNIVKKGEIACNKQFLLFSQCFLPNNGTYFSF